MKVESLAAGRMRREDEIVVQFEGMEARLTIDIEKRGDKRMSDHEKVAKHFLQQVARDVPTPPPSASTFVQQLLRKFAIEDHRITPQSTIGQLGDLATFRRRLAIVAEATGMSFEELKTRVDMDRIPSWVISHGLHTCRQDLPTWEGGELVDSYLASLSPYADLTYVDKRTKENFNRASGRSLPFRRLVRRVEKCGSYLDVLKDMSRDGKAR